MSNNMSIAGGINGGTAQSNATPKKHSLIDPSWVIGWAPRFDSVVFTVHTAPGETLEILIPFDEAEKLQSGLALSMKELGRGRRG